MTSDAVAVHLASGDERHVVEAMMERYLVDLGGSGPYPGLETYWHERQRSPYLLRIGEQAVGFALVEHLDGKPNELVEFYVDASFRGRGVGRRAAESIFGIHAGTWRVGVRNDNALGHSFWKALLKRRKSADITEVTVPLGTIYEFAVGAGEA